MANAAPCVIEKNKSSFLKRKTVETRGCFDRVGMARSCGRRLHNAKNPDLTQATGSVFASSRLLWLRLSSPLFVKPIAQSWLSRSALCSYTKRPQVRHTKLGFQHDGPTKQARSIATQMRATTIAQRDQRL